MRFLNLRVLGQERAEVPLPVAEQEPEVTHPLADLLPIADTSPVSSLAYRPNGYTLAMVGQEGAVQLWNLDVNLAIDQIGATSSITRQQWTAYVPQLPYNPPGRHR